MEKRLAIKTTRQYEEEFNIAEDDVDSDDEATDYRSSFDVGVSRSTHQDLLTISQESSSTTGNSSVSDYSTNYGSSSMNSSGMSGGVQVADEMAFHDFMSADSKDLANRARSSAAPSSNDSTYGSGMRSSQQNSQLRSNSAPHSPFNGFGGGPVAKLAPSVASTETGSRARFPKVHASVSQSRPRMTSN